MDKKTADDGRLLNNPNSIQLSKTTAKTYYHKSQYNTPDVPISCTDIWAGYGTLV